MKNKNYTVNEIKLMLEDIYKNDFDKLPNIIKSYEYDERISIKKILISYESKIKKYEQLKLKLEKMKIFENDAYNTGYSLIAGLDEVGRGPLAGPLVTAGVILPKDFNILGIDDSKKLSESKRNELYEEIKKNAIDITVNRINHDIIDEINILQATKKSMLKNISDFKVAPDYLIIDAVNLNISIPNRAVPKADENSVSVASASIIAKVVRDRIMKDYAEKYPQYGFDKNKGYGVEMHIEALKKYGPCPIHRRSFISNII